MVDITAIEVWAKRDKPTRLDRLYSCLMQYRDEFERIQHNAAHAAQDLDYLLQEVDEWRKSMEEIKNESDIINRIGDDIDIYMGESAVIKNESD